MNSYCYEYSMNGARPGVNYRAGSPIAIFPRNIRLRQEAK